MTTTRCPQCAGVGQIEDVPSPLPSVRDALEFRREQYGKRANQWALDLGMANTNYSEFVHGRRRLPLTARIKAYELGVPAAILLQNEDTTT